MKQLWEFDCYRVDFERRLLLPGEEPVQLPAKALDTLLLLIQRRGEVVTKDELMKAVWWPDAFVEEGNLSQSIHVLRKTLGEIVEDHRYIVSVPGRGYCFVAEVWEIAEISDPTPTLEPTPRKLTPLRKVLPWFRAKAKLQKRWLIPSAITCLVLAVLRQNTIRVRITQGHRARRRPIAKCQHQGASLR